MKGYPTREELRDIHDRYPVEPAQVRAVLARVPPSWTLVERRQDGAAFRRGAIQVILSLELYDDHALWVHISLCGRTGQAKYCLPSWEELKRVKHDFIGDDRWAYQVLPPLTEYINRHAAVLHLFARADGEPALPDFTRGLGVL